jgi:hypothetical protein
MRIVYILYVYKYTYYTYPYPYTEYAGGKPIYKESYTLGTLKNGDSPSPPSPCLPLTPPFQKMKSMTPFESIRNCTLWALLKSVTHHLHNLPVCHWHLLFKKWKAGHYFYIYKELYTLNTLKNCYSPSPPSPCLPLTPSFPNMKNRTLFKSISRVASNTYLPKCGVCKYTYYTYYTYTYT